MSYPFENIKYELDQTLKQIASVSKAKYDGTYFKKGNRSIKIRILKNPDFATNLNKVNGTLYVSPSDARYYTKLKGFIQRI